MDDLRLFDLPTATIKARARSVPQQITASDVLAKGPVFSVGYGSNLYLYRADYEIQAHAKFLEEHYGWADSTEEKLRGKKLAKRVMPPANDEVVVRKLTPDDIERLIAVDPRAVKRVMR